MICFNPKKNIKMKTTILKISVTLLFLSLIGAGCEKDEELPPNHAKGQIIAVTSMCYGEMVLIEVENPKGIGVKGTFSTIGKEIDINYENAIGVPYFSKIGIPDSVPQIVGTQLYFEYRELNDDEKEKNLFSPNPTVFCPAIYGSPTVVKFIITKIINFK